MFPIISVNAILLDSIIYTSASLIAHNRLLTDKQCWKRVKISGQNSHCSFGPLLLSLCTSEFCNGDLAQTPEWTSRNCSSADLMLSCKWDHQYGGSLASKSHYCNSVGTVFVVLAATTCVEIMADTLFSPTHLRVYLRRNHRIVIISAQLVTVLK